MKTSKDLQEDIENMKKDSKTDLVSAVMKLVEVMNRIADQIERINLKTR